MDLQRINQQKTYLMEYSDTSIVRIEKTKLKFGLRENFKNY